VRLALEMLDRLVEAARLSSRTSHQLSDLLREIQPVGIGS
jgi:predicted DNA-binding protein